MNFSEGQGKQIELLTQISAYVAQASGLRGIETDSGGLLIQQTIDAKAIAINLKNLDDVLFRADGEGKEFIQVNFSSNHKILVTDSLIGFKPVALRGLDMEKLPRVVTTPDIVSVFEAIQEAIHSNDDHRDEVLLLRKVFDAVVSGGEAVGFDLATERAWLARLPTSSAKISA